MYPTLTLPRVHDKIIVGMRMLPPSRREEWGRAGEGDSCLVWVKKGKGCLSWIKKGFPHREAPSLTLPRSSTCPVPLVGVSGQGKIPAVILVSRFLKNQSSQSILKLHLSIVLSCTLSRRIGISPDANDSYLYRLDDMSQIRRVI
jgi:hypothetical protein